MFTLLEMYRKKGKVCAVMKCAEHEGQVLWFG
jgi:hypothetical protein